MAKPTDNLSIAQQQWFKVHEQLAPGLKPEQLTALQSVTKQDLQRVAKGQAPLSNQEMFPIVSAAFGKQVIKPQTRPSGAKDVVGNVGRDVKDLAIGLNPVNIAKAVWHEGQDATKFDWSHLASGPALESIPQAFRDLAKAPGLRMLPGIQTGAHATTEEGRTHLSQHPVGTLLDVLPLLGGASKALGVVAPGGSVAESLQAGKPLQAVNRTIGGAAAKIAPETTGKIAESTAAVMRAMKLDPMSRSLQRNYMEAKSSTQRDITRYVDEHIQPFIDKEMTDSERTLLYHEVTNPKEYPNPSPEHQALITQYRTLMQEQAVGAVQHGELHPITLGAKTEYYSLEGAEGKVVKHLQATQLHQSRLNTSIRKFKVREQYVNQRISRNETIVAAAEARLQKHITAGTGTGGRARQAMVALDRAKARLEEYKADPHLQNYHAQMMKRSAKVEAHNLATIQKFIQTAPARYHPMLEAELKARTIARATAKYGAGSPALEESLRNLERGDVSSVWDKSEWKEVKKDVQQGWTGLVAAGYDPVHIHTVTEASSKGIMYGKPMASRFTTPGVVKAKVFDLTPKMTDASMGITSSAVEFIKARATEKMIIDHVLTLAKTEAEVRRDLEPFILAAEAKGARGISSIANKVDQIRKDRWVEFKPKELWNFSTPRLESIASESKVYLPKHIADQVADLSKPMSKSELSPMLNSTTSLFKVSVLTGPRHLAHVGLGGLMFMLGRGHVDDFIHVREALTYAKDPLKFPSAVSHGIDVMSTDQLWAEAAGTKLGMMFTKVAGPAKAIMHFEEKVANFERAMSYLGGKGRALRKGLTAEQAERVGIEHANKIFMDWNGMAPIERSLLKQAMPFYSFTRHILGYVLTYPIDHPLRASILSNIAEIEAADNKTGLPETFQNLFYLGHADKNGNVQGIDLRTFNPMRDVSNYFSLRGFYSSLHPIAQAALVAGGVNPLTGSPALYAKMEFDPATGSMVGRRPENLAMKTAETIIPPITAIDHFLGLTSQMRALKASSPVGARKALFSSLNIPFVPQTYNLAQTRAKIEGRLYSDATKKLSEATSTGDFTDVNRYNLAPTPAKFGGGLQRPQDVQKTYDQTKKLLDEKGIKAAPKAVLPTPKKRRKAALPQRSSS